MEIKINKKGKREIKFNFLEALDFYYSFGLKYPNLTFGEALDLFIKEKKETKGENK